MFTTVGGLDLIFGLPYIIGASILGSSAVAYSCVCIWGGEKLQVRCTLTILLLTGLAMLLTVLGGIVYVIQNTVAGESLSIDT